MECRVLARFGTFLFLQNVRHAATNEFAVEVLEALLEMFDAKIQCHGAHSALLKEISMRVKVLFRMREFLEEIFGNGNEGHEFVDEFQLAKIR